VESFWNRRRILRVLIVFVLPTAIVGLLGGLFWAGCIGIFAAVGLAVMWLVQDDSQELHGGEYATDRNRRFHSMRFPFDR
jgi:hypothetical protein